MLEQVTIQILFIHPWNHWHIECKSKELIMSNFWECWKNFLIEMKSVSKILWKIHKSFYLWYSTNDIKNTYSDQSRRSIAIVMQISDNVCILYIKKLIKKITVDLSISSDVPTDDCFADLFWVTPPYCSTIVSLGQGVETPL